VRARERGHVIDVVERREQRVNGLFVSDIEGDTSDIAVQLLQRSGEPLLVPSGDHDAGATLLRHLRGRQPDS
jgi:hypothetical protein